MGKEPDYPLHEENRARTLYELDRPITPTISKETTRDSRPNRPTIDLHLLCEASLTDCPIHTDEIKGDNLVVIDR